MLVTGHSGFKGKWLSRMLKHFGAIVGGISHYPVQASAHGLESIIAETKGWTDWEMIEDLTDPNVLLNASASFPFQIVIHLAAQPIVRVGYSKPFETFRDNFLTSLNILDFARQKSEVDTVLIVTSDKVYENNNWHSAYRETDTLGGIDPYSCSKSIVELMCKSYAESFLKHDGKQIATARAGNVIGGGDFGLNRLIPDFIRAYVRKEKLSIRYPHAVRPWQYVLEPLNGYLILIEKMNKSVDLDHTYNFGPLLENNASVERLLSEFSKYFMVDVFQSDYVDSSLKETSVLRLDTGKCSAHLGFYGITSLSVLAERTSKVYKSILSDGMTPNLFDSEIRQYFYERSLCRE